MNKVQSLDELSGSVTGNWNWKKSPAKNIIQIGRLVGYPIMVTIKERYKDSMWVQSEFELVINYNPGDSKKVITPDKIKVASTRGDIEDWCIDQGFDPEADYVDGKMEEIETELERGRMVESREKGLEQLKSYVEDGEWYEKLWEGDKMEVA